MILIEKGNVFSRVVRFDTKTEEAEFRACLRFRVPGYFWTSRYRNNVWDGYHSFFNVRTQTFPTGLLDILSDRVKARLEIIDVRQVPPVCPSLAEQLTTVDLEFRDYQLSAVEQAIELERCAIEAPTGSGKTELAVGITFVLARRTLFCVHLENLLWQAKERFENRLKVPVGVISSGIWEPKEITIAMIPTIYSRLKDRNKRVIQFLQNEVDVFFADEVHHLASASSWELPAKICNAYYRYGLSATLVLKDELSNARLIGMTGGVLHVVSKQELIEQGILARPVINLITNKTIFCNTNTWSYQVAYRICIEENLTRNGLICKIAKMKMDENKPVLIIVHTVRHAKFLLNEFRKRQIDKVKLVTGAVEGLERQILLKQLDEGKIGCIIATPVFDEGADIPQLRVLVLAGGGKSPIKLVQRMGRGMRKKEGDNTVEVFDFLDEGNKYIYSHAQQRKRIYDTEQFEVRMVNLAN